MTSRREQPEDVLRRAFEARADRVEFAPDALGSIRTRAARHTHRRRALTMSLASLATVTATAAAATVTAVVVGLASCVASNTAPPAPGVGSDPAPTTASTDVVARLPVYYVGVVRGKPVLYREFHSRTLPATVPATASATAPAESLTQRMGGAVSEMLSVTPQDPDYSSLWSAGASVRGVSLDGDVAVVDLAGVGTNNVGSESAHMAVQQLVWTVTGAAADRGVQLRAVRLLLDGSQVTDLWGHVDISGDLTRAPALQTLAQVWLISPQEGDSVAGTFDVHLDGAVKEATAQLRVRNSAGELVQDTTVTLNEGAPDRGEAHVEATLGPGRYTLEAFYFSAEDGSIQALDNHTITVR